VSYDLAAIYGRTGAGKDLAAMMIRKHRPRWTVVGISDPLLREYERRTGLESGMLDVPSIKAEHRANLTNFGNKIMTEDPLWLLPRLLETERPAIFVGVRPLIYFEKIEQAGALFIEVWSPRYLRVKRTSEAAVATMEKDPYECEMLTYEGPRIRLVNDADWEKLERQVISNIIPLLQSP
jgi:hypothetical protein